MELDRNSLMRNKLSANGTTTFSSYDIGAEKIVETNIYEATTDEIDAAVKLAANVFGVYKFKSGERKAASWNVFRLK